jgi:hypothetical protein
VSEHSIVLSENRNTIDAAIRQDVGIITGAKKVKPYSQVKFKNLYLM